ncbi:hypothetical protein ACXWR7_13075, partial [Streptococcus pyogenes]
CDQRDHTAPPLFSFLPLSRLSFPFFSFFLPSLFSPFPSPLFPFLFSFPSPLSPFFPSSFPFPFPSFLFLLPFFSFSPL